MPRAPKATIPIPAGQTLILDNGAHTIKAGLSSQSHPTHIPNTLAKLPSSSHTYVGSQLSNCKDFAEIVFRRPVQRGQLVNWEAEREIWASSFLDGKSSKVQEVDPGETNLLLAEAPNGLRNLEANTDQVVFEELGFVGYRRCVGSVLNAYGDVKGLMGDPEGKENGAGLAAECVLVVDSGYSHTTVTPVYKGRPIQQAIRRLDVGGKLMTNHLKEILSLRQLDLTHEFHIVNELKEDVCFISRDLKRDLERTWKQSPQYDGKRKPPVPVQSNVNDHDTMDIDQQPTFTPPDSSIVLDYILPDYTTTFRGRSQPHNPDLSSSTRKQQFGPSASETILTLGNERFTTPELLFSPSDIGLSQAGLPEVIMQTIRAIPAGLWSAMLSNVLVVGGNASIPGLVERLYEELRPLAPVECVVRVKAAEEPVESTWRGGKRLVEGAKEAGRMGDVFVTRAEFLENGEGWLMRQFTGEKHLPA